MIIKVHTPLTYARHKEVKIVKPLTLEDKIKGDRWVMIILFLAAIISAIIYCLS